MLLFIYLPAFFPVRIFGPLRLWHSRVRFNAVNVQFFVCF